MRLTLFLRVALALLSVGAFGCARSSTVATPDGSYRTVKTEPLRDTEAAVRANREGLQHLDQGDLDQAAKAFARALSADVEFGPAHNNLGKVYFRRKDWYKAAWEFDLACKYLPRHAEPRNNLGLVYEESGKLDSAVDAYREAVALAPDRVEYRGNLARVLIRRGDRGDEVRALLSQIVEKDVRPEWRSWAQQQLTGMTPPNR